MDLRRSEVIPSRRNDCYHPARAVDSTQVKTADRGLGVHRLVRRRSYSVSPLNESRFLMIKVAVCSMICNKLYTVNRVLIRREFEREIKFVTNRAVRDYDRVKFKL
jgi:hypothetical protein